MDINPLHWQLAIAIVEGDDVACVALSDCLREAFPLIPEDMLATNVESYRSIRSQSNRDEWVKNCKEELQRRIAF